MGIAAVAAIFLLLLLKSIRRKRPAEQTLALPGFHGRMEGYTPSKSTNGETRAVTPMQAVAQGIVAERERESEELPELQVSPLQKDKQQVLSLLEKDPLAVAQVIRDWMSR